MKTAKEQIRESNGLMLEGARKIMELQNTIAEKNKDIEFVKAKNAESINKLVEEITRINKLWQKRFEWLIKELILRDLVDKCKLKHCNCINFQIMETINEAQNKEEFEDGKKKKI